MGSYDEYADKNDWGEKPMNVIDRYVYDVTRRLPEAQREDVAKELKAEILEMVEDEAAGKKPTKNQTYDVLRRMGRPDKLADSYRDRPRYIIGPEYYEQYVNLLKVLLIVVVPIVTFLALMTQLMTTRDPIIETALHVAGTAVEVSVHIFFWTTLTFFVIEKSMQGKRYDDTKEWSPDELPEIPPTQRIARSESYFAIAWSIFAVVATLWQVPAIHDFFRTDVPLFFSDAFWPGWTLGLLAISFLSLFVEVVKLIVGGWTKLTVSLIAIVNIVTIGFFVSAFYLVKPIVNPEFTNLIQKTFQINDVAQSVETGIAVFIAVVAAICVWEITEACMKYRKGRNV